MHLCRLLMKSRLFEPRSPPKQMTVEKKKDRRPLLHPLPASSRSASDSPAPPSPSISHSITFQTADCLPSLPYFSLFFQLGRESPSLSSPSIPPPPSPHCHPRPTRSQSRLSVRQWCDRCVMTRSVGLSTCRPLSWIARLMQASFSFSPRK